MDRRYLRRLIKSKLKKNRRLTRFSVSKTTSPSSESVFSTESSEMLDDKSEASDEDDIGWWLVVPCLCFTLGAYFVCMHATRKYSDAQLTDQKVQSTSGPINADRNQRLFDHCTFTRNILKYKSTKVQILFRIRWTVRYSIVHLTFTSFR